MERLRVVSDAGGGPTPLAWSTEGHDPVLGRSVHTDFVVARELNSRGGSPYERKVTSAVNHRCASSVSMACIFLHPQEAAAARS